MTVPEALEALGLPEGADWGQVQTAYQRLRARSSGSAERERLLEDALLVLRRELLKGRESQPSALAVISAPRGRVSGPSRVLAVAVLAAAAVLAWRMGGRAPSAVPAAPPRPVAGPAAPAAADPGPGAVNYQVRFDAGSTAATREGEGVAARIADTLHYYPLDDVHIVGYASQDEPAAQELARRRAEFLADLLVERHGLKRERVHTDSKTVDFPAAKAEIYIIEGL